MSRSCSSCVGSMRCAARRPIMPSSARAHLVDLVGFLAATPGARRRRGSSRCAPARSGRARESASRTGPRETRSCAGDVDLVQLGAHRDLAGDDAPLGPRCASMASEFFAQQLDGGGRSGARLLTSVRAWHRRGVGSGAVQRRGPFADCQQYASRRAPPRRPRALNRTAGQSRRRRSPRAPTSRCGPSRS